MARHIFAGFGFRLTIMASLLGILIILWRTNLREIVREEIYH